jgi:ribonucleotide reductase alpha subunit
LRKHLHRNDGGSLYFNFDELASTVRIIVRNLNRVIDVNEYPVPECQENSFNSRPIGIGVQALANVFAELRIAFESPEAEALACRIYEKIYLTAIDENAELAREFGPYPAYHGSPASMGILAPDMWITNQLAVGSPQCPLSPPRRLWETTNHSNLSHPMCSPNQHCSVHLLFRILQ